VTCKTVILGERRYTILKKLVTCSVSINFVILFIWQVMQEAVGVCVWVTNSVLQTNLAETTTFHLPSSFEEHLVHRFNFNLV